MADNSAATTLDRDQVATLESIRARLHLLQSNLARFSQEIAQSQGPLPSWNQLQTQLRYVSDQIRLLMAENLLPHRGLLASTVVFPTPEFPGKYKGNIVEILLRSKLEPGVEDWVTQGQALAQSQQQDTSTVEQLWDWAPRQHNQQARKELWGADYTLAEIRAGVDKINTGLQRELELPDDLDEEGDYPEGEEEEVVEEMEVDETRPAASQQTEARLANPGATSMDATLKFMTRGAVT